MLALSSPEVNQLLRANLPPIDHHGELVEDVGESTIRLRLPFKPVYMGTDVWQHSGDVVFSGPITMGFAKTVMYACVHATLGRDLVAVTANLTVTFIRPAKAADLIGQARLVRAGNRHAYVEASVYTDGDPDPIAHVTATYAIARR